MELTRSHASAESPVSRGSGGEAIFVGAKATSPPQIPLLCHSAGANVLVSGCARLYWLARWLFTNSPI
ncbi:hypothetical protein VZT92_007000 [Zoarces viviparus]|uniref:Uncharacterized protein n=1 Tax=Zoarces viviparus TaxID=48416 RepID=A0AAW1FIF7_ZOAVI